MPQISLHTPVGDITLFEADGAIVAVEWGWVDDQDPSPVLEEARRQLDAYFSGDLMAFSLPLDPAGGTAFQRRVWHVLGTIPYGHLRTYGEVAAELGSSARAIGGACGRNPLPILIPCHRIVASSGKLGGYSGLEGLDTKKRLLMLEGATLPQPA